MLYQFKMPLEEGITQFMIFCMKKRGKKMRYVHTMHPNFDQLMYSALWQVELIFYSLRYYYTLKGPMGIYRPEEPIEFDFLGLECDH